MSIDDDGLSPKQIEFRERLNDLLTEYGSSVGPDFDGLDEDATPMQMPVPTAWVLVVDWDDAAGEDRATVVMNSGARLTQRIGLLAVALNMVESE